MPTTLSTELYWLVLTLLMTGLFWLPYILNRMKEHGIWPALYNPQPDTRPQAQWAERMMKAHSNAVENLVIFAPLVFAVHITGSATETTATASMGYFFARLIHYIVYTLGVPLIRTLTFLTGFICQITLAFTLLDSI